MGEDDFRALWFNASEKESYTSISEGRTILISLREPRIIDQRCQIGLKSTPCGERCTTPFYQRLSRDFRYQAPPLFSRALKRSGRLGTRLAISCMACMHACRPYSYNTSLCTYIRKDLHAAFILALRIPWSFRIIITRSELASLALSLYLYLYT